MANRKGLPTCGGAPPPFESNGLTVGDLCNLFLRAKKQMVDSGELSHRTWQDYYDACSYLIDVFGRTRIVSDLTPADGWCTLDFPRGKTGIERRAWLWPETRQALERVIAARPKPKASQFDSLVFVTAQGGLGTKTQTTVH